MDERVIVKELLKRIGWSQAKLAEQAGFPGQTYVTGLLNNNKNGMRVDKLFKILDVMGFELIIRDKRDKRMEWVIKK